MTPTRKKLLPPVDNEYKESAAEVTSGDETKDAVGSNVTEKKKC